MVQKSLLTVLAAIIFCLNSLPSLSQNVLFNDANFKAAVVSNSQINTNGDGEIQQTEAQAFTGLLNVSNRSISDMTGLQEFTRITALYCNNNTLTALNVSQNIKLRTLRCFFNQISSLDVSANTQLTDLRCYMNNLSALDVSQNSQLRLLYAYNNHISSLNLSANSQLQQLQVAFNDLTSLDISANPNLTYLDLEHNELSSLNVKNGHNTSIAFFDATRNFNLACIQVDDVAYAEANWDRVDDRSHFSTDCGSEQTAVVFIPDPNFKAALVNNGHININGDSEIQVSEAEGFGGSLYVGGQNISDLTGIEAFTKIYQLYINDNNLTTVDLSHNLELTLLRCDYNNLTSLDVSALVKLTYLKCDTNELTSLDVSNNTTLTTLYCFANNLTQLDVTSNPNLAQIYTNHNELTELRLGTHPQLRDLVCNSNKLPTVDLTGAPNLSKFKGNLNKLMTIILGEKASLRNFDVDDNLLTSLDLSACPSLFSVRAGFNRLTEFNLKNGNNTQIQGFAATHNPQLTCIQVDDPAYSEANWTAVDEQTNFSQNCGSALASNASLTVFPNPTTDRITIESEIEVQEVRIYGSVNGDLVSIHQGKELDVRQLSKGMYLLRIAREGKVSSVRLVKN